MKAINVLLAIFLLFTSGSFFYLAETGIEVPSFILNIAVTGVIISIIVLVWHFISEFIDN